MNPNESKPTTMTKKIAKPNLSDSPLKTWLAEGVPCYYVRFQNPVSPGVNREPVSEFYIKGPTGKYIVDQIIYTPYGLIFRAFGETDIVPLANVMLTRTV